MKIGIIGAMDEEIIELKNSMTGINEVQINNLKFYEGKLCSKESDMDVTAGGNYKLGEIPRMKSSYFKADPYLFTLAESVATKLFGSDRVHKGRIISRDEFVASSEKVNKLREIFSAECVEMEGAAVAHVCEVLNIPFIVLRSISDKADDEAGITFDEFVKIAAKNSKSIVEGILSIIK